MVAFGVGLDWSNVLLYWGMIGWGVMVDWGVLQFVGWSSVSSCWSSESLVWSGGNFVDRFGLVAGSLEWV